MGKRNKLKQAKCNTSAPVINMKYNILSEIVEDIYKQHVMLDGEETKALVERFKKVTDKFVETMKEVDPTFKEIFRTINGTGSYFDGLRITEATEFDLNLVLKPNLRMSLLKKRRPPGFITIKVDERFIHEKPYTDWITIKANFYILNPNAVRWWFQSVVTKTLQKLGEEPEIHGCKLKVRESGPARTLTISSEKHPRKTIDIDLVPVLEFPMIENITFNPSLKKKQIGCLGLNQTWFAVPKPPARDCPCFLCLSWRVSFHQQESELIQDQHFLKYTLKLVKKVRDNLGIHELASYYIKSLFLSELLRNGSQQWERQSRGHLFMHMLNSLIKALNDGKILFLWNVNCNLIGNVNRDALINRAGQLQNFCSGIDRLVENRDLVNLKRKIEELLA